jgi:hypothetical protein
VPTKTILFFLASLVPAIAGAHEQPLGMEPHFPQQQSARDLLRTCSASLLTSAGRERRRYCSGFISGVEETLRLMGRAASQDIRVCPPPRITARALAQVYIRYGATHGGELDKPAAEVAVQALTHAFPCPDRQR